MMDLRAEDLRFDIYRNAAVGMTAYPNETSSAVRITHLLTGFVEECHEHRSQLRNKEQALGALRKRVEEEHRP